MLEPIIDIINLTHECHEYYDIMLPEQKFFFAYYKRKIIELKYMTKLILTGGNK